MTNFEKKVIRNEVEEAIRLLYRAKKLLDACAPASVSEDCAIRQAAAYIESAKIQHLSTIYQWLTH